MPTFPKPKNFHSSSKSGHSKFGHSLKSGHPAKIVAGSSSASNFGSSASNFGSGASSLGSGASNSSSTPVQLRLVAPEKRNFSVFLLKPSDAFFKQLQMISK